MERFQDPARKRTRWRRTRRKVAWQQPDSHSAKAARCDLRNDHNLMCSDDGESAHGTWARKQGIKAKLAEIAPQLWEPGYEKLIADEQGALAEMGALEQALHLKAAVPPSTYVARGKTRNPEAKAVAVVGQAAEMAATAVRQANQQHHLFSVCARSVAMVRVVTMQAPTPIPALT